MSFALTSKIVSVFDHILDTANFMEWNKHLFGLTKERWSTLAGKSFLVVGAGTGYGRSVAAVLAAADSRVFLTGRRIEKLEETVDEACRLFGVAKSNFTLLPSDITNSDELKILVSKIQDCTPSLHGLVICAAVSGKHFNEYPLQDGDELLWDNVMNTNVKAQWLFARSVLPQMLSANRARVVFMSSGAGWASTPGFGMYNVSKAALNSLACSLADEYSNHYPDSDIQINVVEPGEALTEMNQSSSVSPYSVVSIILFLLSHAGNGPNGKFFRKNGERVPFCSSNTYLKRL